MMYYTDIHSHMLFATDDGPSSMEQMCDMVDEAYSKGTRRICFTPHANPSMFGRNMKQAESAYGAVCDYAACKYPDLELSLGGELGYHSEWAETLKSGECRLLGEKYLLVDFLAGVTLFEIRYALDDLLSSGVLPILAHAERYVALMGEYDLLRDFCRRGLALQLNASAFVAKNSLKQRSHIKKLMAKCPVAAVASDAHNLTTRTPDLSGVEQVLTSRYGEDMAKLWLFHAPNRILDGKNL